MIYYPQNNVFRVTWPL